MGEAEEEFAEYTSAQDRIALGKKSRKLEAKQRRAAMEEMINDGLSVKASAVKASSFQIFTKAKEYTQKFNKLVSLYSSNPL